MATVNKQAIRKARAKQPRYKCPECGSSNVIHQAGCDRCLDCGWNACI